MYVQLRARDGRALLAGPADGADVDDREVDPHSLAYSGVYSDWSIPALALK